MSLEQGMDGALEQVGQGSEKIPDLGGQAAGLGGVSIGGGGVRVGLLLLPTGALPGGIEVVFVVVLLLVLILGHGFF